MKIATLIILLSILAAVCASDGADCKADRDFLIVSSFVEHCAENVKDYLSPNSSLADKSECSNRINAQIFILWLMYFGPWKFDISKDVLVNKYIQNIKAKYRDYANGGSLRDDPLDILNMFDENGSHVAERLPNGSIPNFDAESIHTRKDYTKLVSAYHEWLNNATPKAKEGKE